MCLIAPSGTYVNPFRTVFTQSEEDGACVNQMPPVQQQTHHLATAWPRLLCSEDAGMVSVFPCPQPLGDLTGKLHGSSIHRLV